MRKIITTERWGYEFTAGCLMGEQAVADYLEENWPYNDLTLFMLNVNGSYEILTGDYEFREWLEKQDPEVISWGAAQANSAADLLPLKLHIRERLHTFYH